MCVLEEEDWSLRVALFGLYRGDTDWERRSVDWGIVILRLLVGLVPLVVVDSLEDCGGGLILSSAMIVMVKIILFRS